MSTLGQFVRYAFVGGIAAAVDTGCLYMLHTRLGFHPLAAGAIGFTVGLATNYLICVAWVFESTGRFKEEFALFSLIGIGGLLWTELILWLLVSCAGLPVLPSKAAALALVLVWNFGMRRRFVFADGRAR